LAPHTFDTIRVAVSIALFSCVFRDLARTTLDDYPRGKKRRNCPAYRGKP
jgi:hypothetical protein